MTKKMVRIEDYDDGFAIIVIDGDGQESRVFFDQKDSRKKMLTVFDLLDIEAKYVEVW